MRTAAAPSALPRAAATAALAQAAATDAAADAAADATADAASMPVGALWAVGVPEAECQLEDLLRLLLPEER